MQKQPEVYHSICRWSFHAGKGGFVPANIRPEFANLSPEAFLNIVKTQIEPRVPANVNLGVAVHYDKEIDERSAGKFARKLKDYGLSLAMVTPGGHFHFAYGGIASPDPQERQKANDFGRRTLDLALGPLYEAANPKCPMVMDIWNGSFGYDIPSAHLINMIQDADQGIATLLCLINGSGKTLKMGIEPKPNEGHSAMIYQTSADVVALRERLGAQGIDVKNFGLINEFGHTEMVGLDVVQDYAMAALHNAIVHVHANSQGGDGIRLGGGGKFDIDFGVAPSTTTLGIAEILNNTGYKGWIEHDMQPRPYDNEQQDIDRVARAVCNWEAIRRTVSRKGYSDQIKSLVDNRKAAEFEDLMRDNVAHAHKLSKDLYAGRK